MKHNEGIIGKNRGHHRRPVAGQPPSQAQRASLSGKLWVRCRRHGGDGEEQDVHLLGVDAPVSRFRRGHRGHPPSGRRGGQWGRSHGQRFSESDIKAQTAFQEQFFQSEIYL